MIAPSSSHPSFSSRRAVSLFTILLLLGLSACAPGSSRSAPPSDAACGPSTTASNKSDHRSLDSISMQDAMSGWGSSSTRKGGFPSGVPTIEQSILHTTDGGCHWRVVKPWKYSMEPSPDVFTFFLSSTRAVVSVNGDVFLTKNAGASWSSLALPAPSQQRAFPKQVFFLNADLGWMVVAFNLAGTFSSYDLLQSTDGGTSWSRLHASFPSSAMNTGSQISFRDRSTGWITSSSRTSTPERFWFLQTHDGGRTWHEQRLPSPQGYSSPQPLLLGQPRFFTDREGLLPASTFYNPPHDGIATFITHDGGASWQSQPFFALTTFNPEVSGGPLTPVFTDPSTGWSQFDTTEGNDNDTPNSLSLLHTTDAGRSWQRFDQSLPVRPSDPGFQFVTSRVLFALANRGEAVNGQIPSELYRTMDGGKTWFTLHYTISEE